MLKVNKKQIKIGQKIIVNSPLFLYKIEEKNEYGNAVFKQIEIEVGIELTIETRPDTKSRILLKNGSNKYYGYWMEVKKNTILL